MNNTNIQDAYAATRKFNLIAGNLAGVTPESIYVQLNFIREELDEAYGATEDSDTVELLDGACDLFVTVAGLIQKLEAAGFNVEEALARVCENNLSKFPTPQQMAQPGTAKVPDGAQLHSTVYGHFVYKRITDGKVMKPTNFVSVNLTGLTPEGFFA